MGMMVLFTLYFSDYLLGDIRPQGKKGSKGLLGLPGKRGENGEKGGWQEEKIITFLVYNTRTNIPASYYERDKVTLMLTSPVCLWMVR